MTGRGGPSGRRGSKLDPWKPAIDAIIAADTDAARRRSVPVICGQVGIEGVSIGTVAAYVGARRRRLRTGEPGTPS